MTMSTMTERVIEILSDNLTYDQLNDLYSVVDNDPQEFCEVLHARLSEMEERQK